MSRNIDLILAESAKKIKRENIDDCSSNIVGSLHNDLERKSEECQELKRKIEVISFEL